jgi:coenzyme F420-reducing hydrogenase alpha subunit
LRTADELGFEPPCRNPFRSIIARGLEVIHAYEEALAILRDYREPKITRVDVPLGPGQGCAATEAPRGLLYNRYQLDQTGMVSLAKIVPPTSQNQQQIELDLASWLPRVLAETDEAVARSCERVIRSYDPCISCSTHFLRIQWERR